MLEKAKEQRIKVQSGEFFILSNKKEFQTGKEYVVLTLEFIGNEGTLKILRKTKTIRVREIYQKELLTVVITEDGRRGYLQNVGNLAAHGPEVPYEIECLSAEKEGFEEVEEGDEYDFVIYAGRRVRPRDYCMSMEPKIVEKIKCAIMSFCGRRCMQVFYLLTPGRDFSMLKGFYIENVYKQGKKQVVETTDGRVGINLLRIRR